MCIPHLETDNSRSQWCQPANLTNSNLSGESTGEAEPETGMCCCVCRWEWLELGGNTEVMVCCEERLSDQTAGWKVWGEESQLLCSELSWWQVQASLNLEPVEPQGQTGEKLLLNIITTENNRTIPNTITNYDCYCSYWFIMIHYILWGEKY